MIKINSQEIINNIRLHLNDIFYSMQGEGKYIGIPTLFFRFNQCNISCDYCDTKFEECKIDNVVSMMLIVKNFIENYPIKHICFTGGEPLLFFEEICLILEIIYTKLNFIEFDIKVETNGLLKLPPGLPFGNKVIYTITPKLNFIDDYEKYIAFIKMNNNEINFKFMIEPDTHFFRSELNLILLFLKNYHLLNYDIYFSPVNDDNNVHKILDNYKLIFKLINEYKSHPLFDSVYMNKFKGLTIQLNKLLEWS